MAEARDGKSRSKREKAGEVLEKLEARVGKPFEIALGANPSTGYRWEAHFDSSRISLAGRRYQGEQKMTGGGGREIFTFLALKVGETEIKMILKRPWEREFVKKEILKILIKTSARRSS